MQLDSVFKWDSVIRAYAREGIVPGPNPVRGRATRQRLESNNDIEVREHNCVEMESHQHSIPVILPGIFLIGLGSGIVIRTLAVNLIGGRVGGLILVYLPFVAVLACCNRKINISVPEFALCFFMFFIK